VSGEGDPLSPASGGPPLPARMARRSEATAAQTGGGTAGQHSVGGRPPPTTRMVADGGRRRRLTLPHLGWAAAARLLALGGHVHPDEGRGRRPRREACQQCDVAAGRYCSRPPGRWRAMGVEGAPLSPALGGQSPPARTARRSATRRPGQRSGAPRARRPPPTGREAWARTGGSRGSRVARWGGSRWVAVARGDPKEGVACGHGGWWRGRRSGRSRRTNIWW
jgi:hypothetical protein